MLQRAGVMPEDDDGRGSRRRRRQLSFEKPSDGRGTVDNRRQMDLEDVEIALSTCRVDVHT